MNKIQRPYESLPASGTREHAIAWVRLAAERPTDENLEHAQIAIQQYRNLKSAQRRLPEITITQET